MVLKETPRGVALYGFKSYVTALNLDPLNGFLPPSSAIKQI